MSATILDTNDIDLYIASESEWNTVELGTDGPTYYQIGYTGETLAEAKGTVRSDRIRSDRTRSAIAATSYASSGDISFELAYAAVNELLYETLLSSTFTAVAATTSLKFNLGTDSSIEMTDTEGWSGQGFQAGDWISVSGASNASNNKAYRIVELVAGDRTAIVAPAPGANETAASCTVKTKRLLNGTTKKSVTIEKAYTTLSPAQYERFPGCRISGHQLTVAADQIITGSWAFMGAQVGSVSTMSVVSNSVALEDTDPLTASVDLKALLIDDADTSIRVREISLNVSTNARMQREVENQGPAGIGLGFYDVTGSITCYFNADALALYAKLKSHADASISFAVEDAAGNVMAFYLPRIKITSGGPTSTGVNQDFVATLEFEAIKDTTTSSLIQVFSIAA